MAFFLKNGQGLLLVGQIILYIFLKIESEKTHQNFFNSI